MSPARWWEGALYAEIVHQSEFDLIELIPCQVVNWVAHDIVEIYGSDLVDQHSRRSSGDLELGAMDGLAGRGGGGDDRRDRQRRIRRGNHQAQTPATLFVAAVLTKVDPVDGSADHQASGSVFRSSSLSVSASALNCVNHRS